MCVPTFEGCMNVIKFINYILYVYMFVAFLKRIYWRKNIIILAICDHNTMCLFGIQVYPSCDSVYKSSKILSSSTNLCYLTWRGSEVLLGKSYPCTYPLQYCLTRLLDWMSVLCVLVTYHFCKACPNLHSITALMITHQV